MNENLVRFLGRNATGEICYEALHHRRSKCLWCVSDQVFEGQCIRFEMKNPNDKKWYSSVNVPIRMADGSVYCQSMIRDTDQRKPNFRIIAATSRNLTELVQAGMMRSDFFYRVHVIPIHLPPCGSARKISRC